MKTFFALGFFVLLFSFGAHATTSKVSLVTTTVSVPDGTGTQVFNGNGTVIPAPVDGTQIVEIVADFYYPQLAWLDCTATFNRFLGRPVSGPTSINFILRNPYVSGGAHIDGGVSLTRLVSFGTPKGSGVFTVIKCDGHYQTTPMNLQIKTQFIGND